MAKHMRENTALHNRARQGRRWVVYTARVVFTLLLFGCVVFIFYNSSRVGQVSGQASRAAVSLFQRWFGPTLAGRYITEEMVRKLGHFAEFVLLGLCMAVALRAYTRHMMRHISWPLLAGLVVGVADEFYQQFVPGRSSQVTDIVVDFAGVLSGVAAGVCLVWLVTLPLRKKRV